LLALGHVVLALRPHHRLLIVDGDLGDVALVEVVRQRLRRLVLGAAARSGSGHDQRQNEREIESYPHRRRDYYARARQATMRPTCPSCSPSTSATPTPCSVCFAATTWPRAGASRRSPPAPPTSTRCWSARCSSSRASPGAPSRPGSSRRWCRPWCSAG